MKRIRSAARPCALWVAAFACALATSAQAAPSKQWTIVNLGALGSRGSIPLAVDNRDGSFNSQGFVLIPR